MAPPGNQAVNGENKHQPDVSGETGLLKSNEAGLGLAGDIDILREHIHLLNYSFCTLAPGAMGPVEGLLKHFEDELREHITQRGCPFVGSS